jgi:hypothetical protein
MHIHGGKGALDRTVPLPEITLVKDINYNLEHSEIKILSYF